VLTYYYRGTSAGKAGEHHQFVKAGWGGLDGGGGGGHRGREGATWWGVAEVGEKKTESGGRGGAKKGWVGG